MDKKDRYTGDIVSQDFLSVRRFLHFYEEDFKSLPMYSWFRSGDRKDKQIY